MPEYAKMKNADLEALLKERGLPSGGKKADMVDRLTKDDEKKPEAPSKAHLEDEIDWDDEGDDGAAEPAPAASSSEKQAESEPAAAPESDIVAKAGGTGQPPNPQAVPNQIADIDPSMTDDLSVKPPPEGKEGSAEADTAEKEPAVDYTKGVAATDLDDEIKKRKARAERFGLKLDDAESLKLLERAKKFGESGPPKGLDEALPERRKRGREDQDDGGRNKRRGGGRFGGRRGGGRDGDRRRDDHREDKVSANAGTRTWAMSDADQKRAAERKARFEKSTAA